MSTSDGIDTADWDLVHELVLCVVNAGDDEALADHHRGELLGYLDSLVAKYGELPSLLATRADFVEKVESEGLLIRAYELSVTAGDHKNGLLIGMSLVDLYTSALMSRQRAEEWLNRTRDHLRAGNEDDLDDFRSLEQAVRSLPPSG
jgi:hypothetical protein